MRDVVPPADDAGPIQWRVNPTLPALKALGVLLFVVVGLLFATSTVQYVLCLAGAVGLGVWAARDLVAPVRLAAGPEGVTVVAGYGGSRLVRWDEIERIRVDTRARLGVRTELLEIDRGETLHMFSAYDLSAPPDEVAARLAALRSRAIPPPPGPGRAAAT